MIVNLPFDTHQEPLEADLLAPYSMETWGQAELREHAGLIPLGPGDVVEFDALDVVRNVIHLEPVYTYWVSFHLPADVVTGEPLPSDHRALGLVEQLIEEWKRDAWVTRHSNFDMHVSSQSRQWVQDRVLSSKYVQFHDVIRTPDFKMDFAVAIKHPDRGDGGGPWV